MEIIGQILMCVGAFFIFTSAFGVVRMPDFFTRLHPAGISDTAGIIMIMLGLLLHLGFGLVSLKILLLAGFAILTSTTACHALARAALLSGLRPKAQIKDGSGKNVYH